MRQDWGVWVLVFTLTLAHWGPSSLFCPTRGIARLAQDIIFKDLRHRSKHPGQHPVILQSPCYSPWFHVDCDNILWCDSSLQLFDTILRVYLLSLWSIKGLSAFLTALGKKYTPKHSAQNTITQLSHVLWVDWAHRGGSAPRDVSWGYNEISKFPKGSLPRLLIGDGWHWVLSWGCRVEHLGFPSCGLSMELGHQLGSKQPSK